jgi:crotonobetainyl-CoA:carnitine CoA-transferase CaiB-like acyl-CoA transferase
MSRPPLEGVRVVDMTVVWAGPFGSALLADMGAEVIKIDMIQRLDVNSRGQNFSAEALHSHGGDPAPDARPWNMSLNFNTVGRNKKSVTMDLTRQEGREVFHRLIAKSDFFIENNTADVIEKLGLTYGSLREHNPRLIMVSLPGFGPTGPYRNYRAYGANMEAVVGHTLLRLYPDTDATQSTGVFLADAAAGAGAAFALMAAYHARRRTGRGQFIDMSQSENFIHLLSQAVMDFSMNGRNQVSLGNRHTSRAPQGVYRCLGEDSWVSISCGTDAEFAALCEVIGRSDMPRDERFADGLCRYNNQDEIDAAIQQWTATRTHYEAFHALQAAGVPAGPVLSIPEVFEDPHVRARGNWQRVSHPAAGTFWQLRSPIHHMSKTPLELKPAPLLGEHNEYVYKEICGYSDEEYQWFVENLHAGTEVISNEPIQIRQ